MKITNVRVDLASKYNVLDPRLKAFVAITIDDCFVVRNIKVIDKGTRLFAAMPSSRVGDGWVDLAFPSNKETRSYVENLILEEYENTLRRAR